MDILDLRFRCICYGFVIKTGNHYRKLRDTINSTQDDFSFVIDAEIKKGFVTSNREGGLGSDDIYRFNKFPVPVCNQALKESSRIRYRFSLGKC
jgi:hypothetical protein